MGAGNITEIYDHKKNKKGVWQLLIKYEEVVNKKGKVKTTKQWSELETVFQQCQEFVDAEEEEENFVITYAKQLKEYCPRELQVKIAEIADANVHALFLYPGSTPAIIPPAVASPPHPRLMAVCRHYEGPRRAIPNANFHTSFYKVETTPFYFREDKKWHGSTCHSCNKRIVAVHDANSAEEFKPTVNKPVWVCVNYHLDKAECGMMFCDSCYKAQLLHQSEMNVTGI